MTSRERVLAAIAHREPDRVPVDQGSMRSSGLMAIAYNRLKAHLGVDAPPTRVYDLVQQLAVPDSWYRDRFGVDAIDLGQAFYDAVDWKPWTLPDGSPALVPRWFEPRPENGDLVFYDAEGTLIGRMPKGFTCIDQTCWPLAAPEKLSDFEPLPEHMKKVTWAAFPAPPFDLPLTAGRLLEIGAAARRLCETTDKAIVLPLGCNLFEWSQFLFGMENQYVYLAGEKARFCALLDRLVELHLNFLDKLLPHIKGAVQILVMGDDLGMQSGPQISPSMYKEMFLPRHKLIYDHAKKLSGAHIMLHSCGGIYQLIPHLIEAGVEILNPVQTQARHMEPARLKSEFGRDLTFWGGGCDTQKILIQGKPAEVREDVRRRIETFAPGGGFVWCQIHNVLADVPPENTLAMLEAVADYR